MGRLVSLAIIIWWGAMVGALIWREYRPVVFSPSHLEAIGKEIEDRVDWMGIYAQGQKIGFSTSQVRSWEGGFILEEKALLRLSLLGIPREITTRTSIVTDRSFLLKSFELTLESGPTRFSSKGWVEGKFLRVQMVSAGRVRTLEIPWREKTWVPQTLRYALLLEGALETGKRFSVPMLDPLTFTYEQLEMVVGAKEEREIGGKTVQAFPVTYTWGSLSLKAWVSPEGEVLEEEGLGGLRMVKESEQQAQLQGWPVGKGVDLFRTMAVPVKGEIANPREVGYLKVIFTGADLSKFSLEEGRQKRWGSVVEVTKEKMEGAEDYELPHKGGLIPSEYLSPSLLVQSDDEAIRRKTVEILKGERSALRAVRLIMEWVYENVEKVPTMGVPSAVEVLSTAQGDCNEHAVLFAALARAAGIPTKICAGLLYDSGHFYYHAWNEVFLGKWFSLDATLGQFPADATHIKLVEGELQGQARLVGVIGRLKAEILFQR
jgi:hypothetical protein